MPAGAQEPPESPVPGDDAYVERATRLLQQAVEAGDSLATARAQLALTEHMYSRGLWAEAAAHADLGRNAARLAGDETLLPELEHFMARALLRMERSAEATRLYLSLLDRAEQTGDQALAARASLSLSSLQGRAGDLESAQRFAESALQLTGVVDLPDLRARVLINLARIALLQDRPEQGRAHLAQAQALAAEELTDQTRSSLLMAELNIAANDGATERALAIARRTVALAEDLDSVFFQAFALSQLAPLLCRSGQSEEAIVHFERSAALFEQSDAPVEQSETLMALAQCLHDIQRHEQAYANVLASRSLLQEAHSRQRSDSMQASLAAFQSERQLRELARLGDEEQLLRARVSEQQLRISLMVIGLLLLGALAGVLWMRNRSIAQQRAAQQQLEQTRIDLLARTSHEIRNPAQGLIGLLERQSSNDPRRAEDPDHRSALAAARMIQHLANDYLDLSLLEQGKLRICSDARCRLSELIEHVRQLAESFLGEVMPALNVTVAPGLADWIHADADRLMQVLLNLVINAARYGGDDEIDLILDQSDDGKCLIIRVEDRGPGLGNADTQLFDPYVRGEASGENVRGSGLGLSISARIIDAMGGRMRACNRDRGGARFEIRLPLRVAEPTPEEALPDRAGDAPAAGCPRVLLVDDDRFARMGIRAVLDSFGCETYEAADWSAMQPLVEEHDPPLVLLDRHLTNEDGLEIARRLRERDRRNGRSRRRIVMISGSQRPSDLDQDDLLDDWLIKPVTRARFALVLKTPPID
ncbi:ATP-binding protein [Wenzhouxiangella limi]|uniref:histidine kinase n=1 Tax=Wenzhouxiangella limi TaxID=2707351 RepID=A0A845V718_9GAMM|nr:ATP-binding protein [Wenzhouxiangella limi]NDY96946.1 response regulator [Wenzhouxiangella limi]